jgi:hypothetical protein
MKILAKGQSSTDLILTESPKHLGFRLPSPQRALAVDHFPARNRQDDRSGLGKLSGKCETGLFFNKGRFRLNPSRGTQHRQPVRGTSPQAPGLVAAHEEACQSKEVEVGPHITVGGELNEGSVDRWPEGPKPRQEKQHCLSLLKDSRAYGLSSGNHWSDFPLTRSET